MMKITYPAELPNTLNTTIGSTIPDMGEGFDPIRLSFSSNTAFNSISETKPKAFNTVEFSIFFASSREELATHTEFEIEVNSTYLGVENAGVGKVFAEAKYSATTMFMVASVSKLYQQFSVPMSDLTFTELAKNHLSASSEEFTDLYGAYYVSSIMTGGRLFIVYELKFESIEAKLNAESTLKTKAGSWSSSGNFKTAITTASKQGTIDLRFAAEGGGNAPKGLDPDDVLETALGFPDTVNGENAKPLYVEMSAFWKVPSIPANSIETLILDSVTNTNLIANIIEGYLDLQDDMAWASENSEWIGLHATEVSNITTWLTDLASDLQTFKDAWSTSNKYQIPDPSSLKVIKTVAEYTEAFKSLDIPSRLGLASNKTKFNLKSITSSNKMGDHINAADSQYNANTASDEWYPLMGVKDAAVKLYLKKYHHKDNDPIKDKDYVYIKTVESSVEDNHYLGSFTTKDCYYDSEIESEVRWQIFKKKENANKDDFIRFGDTVRFENDHDKNYLSADGDYPNLTCSTTKKYEWKIERPC